ncbi:hypothetical protein J1TS5_25220 [Paenibacillus macerans]|jgi:hypothetical protein|uniref:DUF4391 domain-containing protein n=1 Tax=Paenibacillus macerans TaxID=44252 RepID=UPI001B2F14C6|nr:DUF4391 domain-containing protein [Paenibacillus macerans]MBS5911987.1 DUF4391 domain-containing protein [Paenibacillus macerans]GIP10352.1 hypothetical protein J1TS5_25220 [Paenibacillus macerans]
MFQLPSSTLVNRKIPKNKFYEKLQANHHLRELFTDQVESIIWKHKLSKDTIRLEPKEDIEEIQIFEVHLKVQTYSLELLRSIDKAIPYPILHVLTYDGQAKLAVAYKERNQTDDNRSVVRSYHETDWQPMESIEMNILQGLDLKAVYENIIRQLLPIKVKPEIELTAVLERQAQIDKLTQECQRLESKIRVEKQFNKKVELNMELQRKRKELNQLLD